MDRSGARLVVDGDRGFLGIRGSETELRPYVFLVSTSRAAGGIKDALGSAAYSYYFVLEALAPVLDRLGTWTLIDRPESRLAYAAAKARGEGLQPIHLSINPLQDTYLTTAAPNVVFPFWEFPDIPNRSFGYDTRQNWSRIAERADLIISACEFTAGAFRAARVSTPVAVIPVPLRPEHFEIPAWDRSYAWKLSCRHVVFGGPASVGDERDEAGGTGEAPTNRSLGKHAWYFARASFRTALPYLGTKNVERVTRLKLAVLKHAGLEPVSLRPVKGAPRRGVGRRVTLGLLKDAYNKLFKRWLSDEAISVVNRVKVRMLRLLGKRPELVPPPSIPREDLTLSGLVYTSLFNLGDNRKNEVDLLSAFLLAFRDRSDVTLVIKLATSAAREHQDVEKLRETIRTMGIKHDCRIVVITEFLSDEQMTQLTRVTTYYVNTSRAEGACLPLQQALAGGRPAIAPAHTAAADFMDERVGFTVRSSLEPTFWPHDPDRGLETTRGRLDWESLRNAYVESARIAEFDPSAYRSMAAAARDRMSAYAGRAVVERALREAIERVGKHDSRLLRSAS